MVCGSWRPVRERYVEEIERFCNEQSIWIEDGRDHLMMYHPSRKDRDKIIAYLKSKGMVCGELFYTGIWFWLNEKSKVYDFETQFQETLKWIYA